MDRRLALCPDGRDPSMVEYAASASTRHSAAPCWVRHRFSRATGRRTRPGEGGRPRPPFASPHSPGSAIAETEMAGEDARPPRLRDDASERAVSLFMYNWLVPRTGIRFGFPPQSHHQSAGALSAARLARPRACQDPSAYPFCLPFLKNGFLRRLRQAGDDHRRRERHGQIDAARGHRGARRL